MMYYVKVMTMKEHRRVRFFLMCGDEHTSNRSTEASR